MKTINSFRSKLLALTLALMASVASFAYEFEYVNDFHIDGFGYKIISVNTPDDGEGYVSLIEIADCKKDVVIPKYVSYGDRGFHVTTFGMSSVVFTNDASSVVESITIPKTTNIINKNVLAGCPNLKTVVVDSENPYYDSRENCNAIITTSQNPYFTPNTLIAGCKTTLIPNSVVEIGENAFYDCESLETITIPNSVTKIGKSAFNVCSTLSSITLSENLTEIGNWAFDDCNNLKEVICYAPQPPTISKYTFSDISPTIYVPENTVTIYQNAPYWMTFDIQPIQPSYKSQWCDTWNVFVENGSVYPPHEETYRYQLAQDIVIGDYTYTAVVSKAINDALDAPHYVAAVRFTDDRKVYIYYDNAEYLLYDFNVQQGDELEVFAGINNYTSEIKTYKCTVTGVEQYACVGCPATITLEVHNHPDDFREFYRQTQWIEGVGDINGFLNGINGYINIPGNAAEYLLCAYKGDELKYTGPLYEEYGCGDDAEQTSEDLFPTLWGLQRTVCNEYCGDTEDDNSANFTYKQTFDSIFFENDKPYILCNGYLLREEDNKIFLYSQSLNKDIVLYDFTLEVGDSLPAYIKDFDGTMYSDDTLVVTDISSVTLLDGKEYKKWTFDNGMEYVEGIGMYGGHRNGNFFGLIQEIVVPCHTGTHLVCVSKNGKLLYQMDEAEMERLGAECLCEAENPEDLFPTLWGLQRTTFYHYTECSDSYSSLTASNEIVTINDKPYLRFGKMFLREENNQVLIYSAAYDKDLVLYDWNLEVGDSISLLAMDYGVYPEYAVSVVDYRVIVDIDENGDLIMDTIPTDKVVVDKISTITLLDGKEYKTWHLATGWAGGITYVEGIGILSEGYGGGDYLGLIRPEELPTCYYGDLLVCVSKNNKLLYQMDPVKMDELGTECLCDYDRGPRKDNAKDGQIGGRPTPTQWNQLELDLREMDNGTTILRAETFSYTLEDISQQVNNKTYFQLARQSTKDTATTKSVVGALHFGKDEDNRVYFLRDGVEYILYDFTAEIGDTVEIFAGINNYPQETTYIHIVTGKDTLENGACRMLLEVVFPDDTNATAENAEKVWLAGLGSVDGIVHNAAKRTSNAHAAPSRTAHSSDTQTSVMLCAWREDSCLYTTNHPDYNDIGCIYNQDPTSIEDTHSSSPMTDYQKLLRNGQLLIIHKGKTYNVLGVQIK